MATTVYQSVDERGRVTYSDTPPTQDTLVSSFELKVSQPAPQADDALRFAALKEVTDRMQEDGEAREARRKEARKQAQPQQVAAPPQQYRYARGGKRRWLGGYYPVLPGPDLTGRPAITSSYPAKLVRRHYGEPARSFFQGRPAYPNY